MSHEARQVPSWLIFDVRQKVKRPKLIHPTAGERGMTDLHYAAYCQDLAAVKRCVEQGCDVNQEDDGGWPPILWAIDMTATAKSKGIPESIVDYLLDHGARFELKIPKHKTILEFARDHDGYVEEHLLRRIKKSRTRR